MMISDQDKQRIEDRSSKTGWSEDDYKSFIAGAEYEHPIAYNKALDDFDFILIQKEDYLHGEEGKLITELRKELQKMRK